MSERSGLTTDNCFPRDTKMWPSRRTVKIVIAMLALSAALVAFFPPLTPHRRAEKLYVDGWFAGGTAWAPVGDLSSNPPAANEAAIRCFESALRLSPGNSLYEQALVWHYPPKILPRLLKERRLGPEARGLAAGLIFEHRCKEPEFSTNAAAAAAAWEKRLSGLEELRKADPGNALVHYRKAFALKALGRPDDAFAEVRAANRLGNIRFYVPDASDYVLETPVSPAIMLLFSEGVQFRDLARFISARANDQLRHGRVDQARSDLQECCTMGVNYAAAKPGQYIGLLVGSAVFGISAVELGPVYKDFGPRPRVATLIETRARFGRATQEIRSELFSGPRMYGLVRQCIVPEFLVGSGLAAAAILLVSALLWMPAAILRRRRKEAVVPAAPWGEGWLARILCAVYLPMFAISVGAPLLVTSLLPDNGFGSSIVALGLCSIVGLAAGEIILLSVIFRALHRAARSVFGTAHGHNKVASPIAGFRKSVDAQVRRRGYGSAVAADMLLLLCGNYCLQTAGRRKSLADRQIPGDWYHS